MNDPAPEQGGTFARILEKRGGKLNPPPVVVDLPPAAFAGGDGKRAASLSRVGVRTLSETEVEAAQKAAEKALEPEDGGAEYNDNLCAEIVARASTQALDSGQPFFEMGALSVKNLLTPDGVRRLYQEYEVLRDGSNPAMPEAGPEEFSHLIVLYERGLGMRALPRAEAKKVRRLLEWCRQALAVGEAQAVREGAPLIEEEDDEVRSAREVEEPARPGEIDEALEALRKRKRS